MANPPRAWAEDIAWAAGLFEGEGCVGLNKGHTRALPTARHIYARITMTDEDVVRKFAKIMNWRVYGPYNHGKAHHKSQWATMASNFEQVQAMVAMFWPWLGSRRREQARGALRNQTSTRGRGQYA